MSENDPKPTPFDAFSLVVRMLRDVAGMELPGIELPELPKAELPRGVPITQERNGIYYLVGLTFPTAAEAEDFAIGLEKFVDRDGARLFLKRPPPIIRDGRGNCSGIN